MTFFISLIVYFAFLLVISSFQAQVIVHNAEKTNRRDKKQSIGLFPHPAEPYSTKTNRAAFHHSSDMFSSCAVEGYLDASAYPLVDAQLIFCGGVNESFDKQNEDYGLSGFLSLAFAKPCSVHLPVCQLYIQLGERKRILLRNVTDVKALSIIKAETALLFNAENANQTVKKLVRRNHFSQDHNLYFLPTALSKKRTVLSFLRFLSYQCSRQVDATKPNFFISISNLTLNEGRTDGGFCMFMELLGGSIRQSYVLGYLPCNTTVGNICTVTNVDVTSL